MSLNVRETVYIVMLLHYIILLVIEFQRVYYRIT